MEKTLKRGGVGANLTEGPILKSLLIFAVPIVLANLVQQLYAMVDLIIIGQFVGNTGTVGVSTGGEFAELTIPIAAGFAAAGQIYISQLVGARQEQTIKRTVGTLVSFMMLLSFVLMIVGIVFCEPILHLLNCQEAALEQAKAYMIITSCGVPFVFGYNAICGILRGMGESKRPLIFILIAATVNIFFDLLLVVVIPMEAAGTAIATVASQFGSCAAAFIFMWKKRDKFGFELNLSYFLPDKHILKIMFRLGLPQVARGIMVHFSMAWVNSMANSYSMVVSATNSIGNKLQKFLEIFISSVDAAAGAMIGQNLGAKKYDRASKIVWNSLGATLVCAAIISLVCIFLPKQVFGIFTPDEEVKSLGVVYMSILIVHIFSSATVGSFQTIITGSGFTEFGLLIGLLDGVICKIGLSWTFVNVFHMGYLGLFWGVSCSRILTAAICAIYFLSNKWRTRKLLTD